MPFLPSDVYPWAIANGSGHGTIRVALKSAVTCSADRSAIGTGDDRQTRPHK
jgi:hypothetical protein